MKNLYILLKEQYILLTDPNNKDPFYYYEPFICNVIDYLSSKNIITINDKLKLVKHFRSQFPNETLHPEFYKNELFNHSAKSGCWFKHSEFPLEGVKIRIDFLNKIISTL